jgi:hypothetical protein
MGLGLAQGSNRKKQKNTNKLGTGSATAGAKEKAQ